MKDTTSSDKYTWEEALKTFLPRSTIALHVLGRNPLILLANLCDKYWYLKENGMLRKDGSFSLTHEAQRIQTGLSDTQIRASKKVLVKLGILTTKRLGLPSSEYYYIDTERLYDVLHESRSTHATPDATLED